VEIEGGEANLTYNFNRVSLSSRASNALAVIPFTRVSESATDGNLDEDGVVGDL